MNCTKINLDHLALTKAEREAITHPNGYIVMEAAMCAWEHLIEKRDPENGMERFGGYGQARMCCASLAFPIHVGYCIASIDDKLDGYAYDWEFVPWFLDTCVIWDTADSFIHGEPLLVDDWVELCRKLDFSAQPVPEPQLSDEDFLRKCLSAFNELPNQRFDDTDTYALAAALSKRLSD